MQMSCHRISTNEFKCCLGEDQTQTKNSFYGLGDRAGIGIPLASILITSGIYVPIAYAQRTYKNLNVLDKNGHSTWSRLSVNDKLKSVIKPLLVTGAGLLATSGGILIGYSSVSDFQECCDPFFIFMEP